MYCTCFVIINRILWIELCRLCGIFPSFIDSSTKLGVFCLLRLGSQVLDTQSLVVVDRTMTDISFPDVMILWVGGSHIIQGEEMHYDNFQWNFVPLKYLFVKHCKLHVHCTSCACMIDNKRHVLHVYTFSFISVAIVTVYLRIVTSQFKTLVVCLSCKWRGFFVLQ